MKEKIQKISIIVMVPQKEGGMEKIHTIHLLLKDPLSEKKYSKPNLKFLSILSFQSFHSYLLCLGYICHLVSAQQCPKPIHTNSTHSLHGRLFQGDHSVLVFSFLLCHPQIEPMQV